ncbi:hypothetical protein DPMN_174057 [Dreissena polymorpha]|uniref:Uncharacterized protein n=1 Tax=Dreissena polymorpha TaxID=45954 RepID=A0A9D4II85_DREPO|nr:hypothetical protein DPMN_174057 [Dreissena polymorpha]
MPRPQTKFHEDRTINVTSSVLAKQMLTTHDGQGDSKSSECSAELKYPTNELTFSVQPKISLEQNVLTKFHEETNVLTNCHEEVLTRFYSNVVQPIGTIFKQIKYIIEMNLLAKFHEDRTINVASRVLKRKNALPPGGHVFQATGTIFELV